MEKVSSRRVTWTDLERPDERAVLELSKKHLLHPLVGQELLVPTYRPKVEQYDEHLYLVLHFPVFDQPTHSIISREIDFIIFPYSLISVHYEDMPQFDEFQKLLADHEALRERKFGESSGHLLHSILSFLFSTSRKELDKLDAKIKEIEDRVFSGTEEQALRNIAQMKRDILNFQKALKPQRAILDSLEEHGKQFFGPDMKPYFSDIKAAYIQVSDTVENLHEILDALYDTNVSLLSVKTNEVVKTLTVFTVIVMPLNLIAFIYAMAVPWVPLRSHPNAFFLIMIMMATIAFSLYRYFRNRRWI